MAWGSINVDKEGSDKLHALQHAIGGIDPITPDSIGAQPIEEGKGLSTNDFTDELKSKLEGIENNAEVNVIEKVTIGDTEITITDKGVVLGGLAGKDKVSESDLDDSLKTKIDNASSAASSALTDANIYTDEKIGALMNNSSEAVDSIMELAQAMAENEGVVEALEQAIGTKANQSDLNSHINNFENPHNINKGTLGLDKVENKSSAEIIDEITKDDITGALGFTPVNAGEVNSAISSAIASKANVSDLNNHVNDKNNPHGITPSQIGAPTTEEMNAAIAAAFAGIANAEEVGF